MHVQNFANLEHAVRPDGVEMTNFFDLSKGLPGSGGVSMGCAVFPPGMESPPATHAQDEYAFILKGEIGVRAGGQVFRAGEGCATFIPAGEGHVSFNDSDGECRLVWLLAPKA